MRIFNEVVFDSYVTSLNQTFTDPKYDALLGAAEELSLMVLTDQVSGTSPTVTVQVQHSADRRSWASKNASAEIASQPANSGSAIMGQDTGSVPGLAYGRLAISLGGTSPGMRLRIFATGHAEQAVSPQSLGQFGSY